MRSLLVLSLVVLGLGLTLVSRVGVRPALAGDLDSLALVAIDGDSGRAEEAVRALRAAGPAGLRALMALHATDAKQPPSPARARLHAAIDRVAAQKDARHAGLYWHTDETEALARARAEGKPVLSLRLLGRLDEDASCANSRYFRTTLYPDPAVGAVLRERFVLHWRSMRPVPRLTVDFGDGRVIERPITGNSAHLVLDARGRVVDAIPGLVGAGAFLEVLAPAEEVARTTAALDVPERTAALRAHHRARLAVLDAAWAADLAALGRPLVAPAQVDDLAVWTAVAARHAALAALAPASVAVIAEKHSAPAVDRLTVGKSLGEAPLVRAVRGFESSVAVDTVRNEQRMHRTVHEWFVGGTASSEPQPFAERLYREVFLTPPEDPWLGLLPAEHYAALDGGGVRSPAASPAR